MARNDQTSIFVLQHPTSLAGGQRSPSPSPEVFDTSRYSPTPSPPADRTMYWTLWVEAPIPIRDFRSQGAKWPQTMHRGGSGAATGTGFVLWRPFRHGICGGSLTGISLPELAIAVAPRQSIRSDKP